MTTVDLPTVALGVVQAILTLALAPLLLGITKRVKARLAYRRGAPLLQPYRDLAKWWAKVPVESEAASALTALAPPAIVALVVVASLLVPLVGQRPLLDGWADVIVVIGLLAAARFLMALSALDAGSAFGGMGSSREVAIASLVEPALLLALAGAALAARTTDLGTIAGLAVAGGIGWLTPPLLLGAAAFAVAAVAETGHEPFDNPDTHLELTMVHEGMLLEASGPRLAMLTYAAEVRLIVVVSLFAAVFLPFGMAAELTPLAVVVAVAAAVAKLVVAAVALALLDAGLAKLRILALPGLLGFASMIAIVGLAARLWLPA